MSLIKRALTDKLLSLSHKFPILGVLGPRQSGKTTLVRMAFPNYRYLSLEDPDIRALAINDPKTFLKNYAEGVIIDEAQHAPHLFSYLQTHVDELRKNGLFILTGSQNFTLSKTISQSLTGRIALLTLLPLSYEERQANNLSNPDPETNIFYGGYPKLYQDHIDPPDFFPSYIRNYLDRDIPDMLGIHNSNQFYTFIKLCAGHAGQLINYSSLANDVGVSYNTIKAWLGVLETSYIIFLLRPLHNNFNKRFIKSSKLYFYDTGLLCSLLEIETSQTISLTGLKGPLFENFVITELMKYRFNQNRPNNLYFWRDKTGHEIDCLYQTAGGPIPFEIKSSRTFQPDFVKNLKFWNSLSDKNHHGTVIYAGEHEQSFQGYDVINWQNTIQCLAPKLDKL